MGEGSHLGWCNPVCHRPHGRSTHRQGSWIDPVLRSQRPGGVDGAVLGPDAFVLRFFAEDGHDRLLVVNLGHDLHFDPAPEPLLAPPEEMHWETLWSSEDPCYGGTGTPPLESEDNWRIPGEAAVLLLPRRLEETQHA